MGCSIVGYLDDFKGIAWRYPANANFYLSSGRFILFIYPVILLENSGL
jgi:hypothetical protein